MQRILFLSMFIKPHFIPVHVIAGSYLVLPHQQFVVVLLSVIELDVLAMNQCEAGSFTTYPLLHCQGMVSGLEGIMKTHPDCVK